jgi:dynein heavy chain, axonemal
MDLENDLLRIMYESQVPLLENEELFMTLQTSQRTSLEVKEALLTSQDTEKEIDSARQVSSHYFVFFPHQTNFQATHT